MMLRHLGETAAADRIEDAVLATLESGDAVTQDLARQTGGDVEHADLDDRLHRRGHRALGHQPSSGGRRDRPDAGPPPTPLPGWDYSAARYAAIDRRTVGIDIFIAAEIALRRPRAGARADRRTGPFELQMISSRGTKVYPPTGLSPGQRQPRTGRASSPATAGTPWTPSCSSSRRGSRPRTRVGPTSRSSTSSTAWTASRRRRASRVARANGARRRAGGHGGDPRRARRGSAPLVGIVGGSRSDFPILERAVVILTELGIPSELRVVSAHRTPDLLYRYAEEAPGRGIRVIVAGAGGAAHLPGMLAAKTLLPVIGVPIPTEHLGGLDSLLSIVQMPRGSRSRRWPSATPRMPRSWPPRSSPCPPGGRRAARRVPGRPDPGRPGRPDEPGLTLAERRSWRAAAPRPDAERLRV